MSFGTKLRKLMNELHLNQTQLSALTGINKSSLSQYISEKNVPSEERRKEIAYALGVSDDFFETEETAATVCEKSSVNLPIALVAKLMGKSKDWVMQGLRDGVFPWGYAVKMSQWSYFVSAVKFTEYTGIPVPENH